MKQAATPEAKVTKTDAVRKFLKEHPTATNKEVSDGLQAQGIAVTTNHVGNIKVTLRKRRKRTAAAKPAVAHVTHATQGEHGVGVAEIKAGLVFLKTIGSVALAKEALASAEEIRKIVV
jgi:arginine repressor